MSSSSSSSSLTRTCCSCSDPRVKRSRQDGRQLQRVTHPSSLPSPAPPNQSTIARIPRLIAARILLVRWLPIDVARIWACNWLEHVLSPKSLLPIPKFPPSGYLSLPLPTLLNIAREYGGLSSPSPGFPDAIDDGGGDEDVCAVCLERACNVAAEVCGHELCLKCALDLCTVIKAYEVPGLAGAIPCPLCRSGIASFRKAAASAPPTNDTDDLNDGLPCSCARCCGTCSGGDHGMEKKSSVSSCRSPNCQSDGVDSEAVLPLYCAHFTPPVTLS